MSAPLVVQFVDLHVDFLMQLAINRVPNTLDQYVAVGAAGLITPFAIRFYSFRSINLKIVVNSPCLCNQDNVQQAAGKSTSRFSQRMEQMKGMGLNDEPLTPTALLQSNNWCRDLLK
uniref:Uncharacterized protein n=1 Tax=Romanomermis culicivorax TaxID=13658 RepID=A0A915IY69_ROMCU